MSGSTTTAALTTRAITDRTSVGALTNVATWANSTNIPTVNLIAYWDGRYQTTSNKSNLAYCNKGAFGAAATYAVDDATTNGALGTGTGLTTERSVYNGLVIVNNASQTRATSIYAPTSAGTANTILVSSGGTSAPTWTTTAATVTSSTSTSANTAAYATLTLGNNANVSTTTAHAEGQILLYSAATAAHTLKGASTTTAYTSTLPNVTGILVSLDGSTAKGSATKPIYVPATGVVTECSTYAGGTAVTLNGTDKGTSTASFYAPTGAGTAGQVLISAGSGAPAWHAGLTLSGTAADSYVASFTGTTDSTTSTTGAVKIAGGLGVAKAIYSGGNIITSGQIGAIGAGEHYLEAQNSTYGNILRFVVSGDGQTAGIWSSGYVNSSGAYTAGGKWLIYRNVNNAVVIGDNLWISGWGYSNSGFQINGTYTQLINNYLVMPYWTMHFTSSQVQFHFNTNGTGSLSNKVAHLTSGGVFTNSSRKVKTNIIPLPSMGNIIDNLKPVEFSYTYDPKRTRNYGLIYEDTINLLPYICDPATSNDDRPGINYAALTPVLLKEIQDLRKRVKTLEEQLSQN